MHNTEITSWEASLSASDDHCRKLQYILGNESQTLSKHYIALYPSICFNACNTPNSTVNYYKNVCIENFNVNE